MFNPGTEYEVSPNTSHKDMKGNAKCKNFRFETFFGELRGNAQGSLWLDEKRIVDFLLVIIELFSLALTAEALLSEICQNRHFMKGWVTLSVDFR